MTLTKQEQFFYDHAGFSLAQGETMEQGKERSAREYAQAETWALREGYTFGVEPDPDADESFMNDESEEYQREWRGKAWVCVMYDDSPAQGIVQSLCGCYGNSEYERVVKAELAAEQMAACRYNAEDFQRDFPREAAKCES